jgi:hypothetical protein
MTAGPSTPPVVTLFESYGAGASEVGPRVAQSLGVRWDPRDPTRYHLTSTPASWTWTPVSTSSSTPPG